MVNSVSGLPPSHLSAYRTALWLSVFTIAANLLEGVASTILGYRDETLALFGFGIDSFIEVISAVGVTIMILRIQRSPISSKTSAEITALRMTGISFYLLTAGLLVTGVLNMIQQTRPESTLWGIVISLISLLVMVFLMNMKLSIGRKLGSEPIIADAHCTRACISMSAILLASSLIYYFLPIPYLDSIGALGIAYLSFKEGREAFEKAANKSDLCTC